MPTKSLKSRTLRQSFVVFFPIIIAIIIVLGVAFFTEESETQEEAKEVTGIDARDSTMQMVFLLAIAFAITFTAFLLLIPGLIRKRR